VSQNYIRFKRSRSGTDRAADTAPDRLQNTQTGLCWRTGFLPSRQKADESQIGVTEIALVFQYFSRFCGRIIAVSTVIKRRRKFGRNWQRF
jgi:hypothetical protein